MGEKKTLMKGLTHEVALEKQWNLLERRSDSTDLLSTGCSWKLLTEQVSANLLLLSFNLSLCTLRQSLINLHDMQVNIYIRITNYECRNLFYQRSQKPLWSP